MTRIRIFNKHSKTMKFEKITAALAVLLLSATGCSQDAEGPKYTGGDGFAFAATVLNVETGSEDEGKVLVPVYRGNSTANMAQIGFEIQIENEVVDTVINGEEKTHKEQIWVNADPDGIFSLTTPRVIFADGANVAYAQIRYTDIEALGLTTKHKIRLTIKDGLSPSKKGRTTVSVSRKLTFDLLGKCKYFDICLFSETYEADIYLAREAEIYRVMDPYSEGLLKEDYVTEGWGGTPDPYVQFACDDNGNVIRYEPFCVGMMVNGKYTAYAYWPSDYKWGRDFSDFDKENKKIWNEEEQRYDKIQLYPVYCLPSFQYGFLNEGAYPVTITLP